MTQTEFADSGLSQSSASNSLSVINGAYNNSIGQSSGGLQSGLLGAHNSLANYPYYICTYPQYVPSADVEVRLAANGFMVKRQGIEYVFSNVKELAQWLTKEFQPKKK